MTTYKLDYHFILLTLSRKCILSCLFRTLHYTILHYITLYYLAVVEERHRHPPRRSATDPQGSDRDLVPGGADQVFVRHGDIQYWDQYAWYVYVHVCSLS